MRLNRCEVCKCEGPTGFLPITASMPEQVLLGLMPYLAVLIYLMVNTVLSVLAASHRHAISQHDRVRQAVLLHQEYLHSLVKHEGDDAAIVQ